MDSNNSFINFVNSFYFSECAGILEGNKYV